MRRTDAIKKCNMSKIDTTRRRCNMSRIDVTIWRWKNWIMIRAHKRIVNTWVFAREEILELVWRWKFKRHCEWGKTWKNSKQLKQSRSLLKQQKTRTKKNNSKVSQVQTLDFQTFIKYKGCVMENRYAHCSLLFTNWILHWVINGLSYTNRTRNLNIKTILKTRVVHLEVGQEIKHNGSWMRITLVASISH